MIDSVSNTTENIQESNIIKPKLFVKLFGKDLCKEVKNRYSEPSNDTETSEIEVICEEASTRIRELMNADNFSILTGAGSSVCLGGPTFGISSFLSDDVSGWLGKAFVNTDCKEDYEFLLDKYTKQVGGLDKLNVEGFITFLYRLSFSTQYGFELFKSKENNTAIAIKKVKDKAIAALKQACDLNPKASKTELDNHKTFIKRIIARPINLRRTRLFTTNYDLLFERAMDEMGIIYTDGFIGGLKKYFHPASFNYDYYYPASTTEGKVSRMERVLHFFKLHGSLSWVESKDHCSLNVYQIEKKEMTGEADNILIYPTPLKEQDTIGFPYSEMFRKFADAIQQPQSVLITYGYGFGDEHINRIIYEALSIPSFQLVIVSFDWTDNIWKIYEAFKDEDSVGFIIGKELANWSIFVRKIIPNLPTSELEEKYLHRQQRVSNILATSKACEV